MIFVLTFIFSVFSWGLACYGALGNPNFVHPKGKKQPLNSLHHPATLTNLEVRKVRDIACGYGYSIFAAKHQNGHLLGCGINNFGQIGYHEIKPNSPLQVLIVPSSIKLPVKSAEDFVTRVECGQSHTIVLTNLGEIFSLGSNAYGQCGRPVIEDEDYLNSKVIYSVKIPELESDDEIIDLECGINHSMFLSKKGCVFSCGWSADGQTGLGHYENQSQPKKLEGDIKGEKIVKVSCVADNVLALNGEFKTVYFVTFYGNLTSIGHRYQNSQKLP